MADDKKLPPEKIDAGYNGPPDAALELSHNGPPKATGPTMNMAGQTPPSGKVSASPPPPPKK